MPEDGFGGGSQVPTTWQRWSERGSGGPAMPGAGVSGWFLRTVRADPEVLLFATKVSVWLRWFVWAVALAQMAHRPEFWLETHQQYLFLHLPLVVFNGLAHYRLHRGWVVTWRRLLFLSAVDVALITGAIVMAGDFDIYFFVGYYPALALFAAVFTSLWLGLAWTTMVALVYAVVSLGVYPGLDLASGEEKALLGRIAAMYAVVGCVSLIARFERVRRQESAERERGLHRQRIELSQAIHDSAAQTAYMVGLGIHRAIRLAGDSNQELTGTLAATSSLSKMAVWELRRPIDEGHIFEGRELGRVLWSHVETFEKVTSTPAEMFQSGAEPPLALETKARLFSIAHNALSNAFLHAQAGRIEVRLDFGADRIRLSVADDGVGLPGDYEERGRGFRGMRADAERLGGRLTVETGGPGGGTTVTCEIPRE